MSSGAAASGGDRSEGLRAADRASRTWRWIRAATLLGIGISILAHLFLWLIAGLIMVFTYSNARPKPIPVGDVEFAVVIDEEFSKIQSEEIREDTPVIPETPTDLTETSLDLLDASMMSDVASLSLDLDEIGSSVGAGDVGSISKLATGVTGAGTSFFGVEAEGFRFAYIVDMSGSMEVAGKWERTRQELIASIEELSEGAMFLVVLFSSDAALLDGRKEWSDATDRNKRWVRGVLSQIAPSGATHPMPAFMVVLTTRPRPDAIYFMTDGQFDESAVVELQRMNMEMQIPIHCITFGDRSAEVQMRQIAKDSGGSYTHVEVSGP